MPFDGSESNPIVQGIDRIEALFDGGKNWCQGAFHDLHGRHCLLGAAQEVEPNFRARQRLVRCLQRAIPTRFQQNIARFNDSPKTTFEDVMVVLLRAREIARGMPEDVEPQNPIVQTIDDVEAFFGDGEKWLQGCGCDNEGAALSQRGPVRCETSGGRMVFCDDGRYSTRNC